MALPQGANQRWPPSILDGLSFDTLSLSEDFRSPAEVDIGRGQASQVQQEENTKLNSTVTLNLRWEAFNKFGK